MQAIEASASITDRVVEAIRGEITAGRLRPGELYSVQTLADQLRVSRTPVREALVRLAEVGMVRFERNRGVLILEPTVRDLEEIFQLRLMVEPPAAYRAAREVGPQGLSLLQDQLSGMEEAALASDDARFTRFMHHDVRFHELVLEAAGNSRLVLLVRNLRNATRTLGDLPLLRDATRSRDASTSELSRSLEDVMSEHTPVLEALKVRDSQEAALSMYRHVRHTGDMLINQRKTGNSSENVSDSQWAKDIPMPPYGAINLPEPG